MRLWHYELLPYLPDLQFKGQLRELIVIMRDWRDKGNTNHLLINRVMEYGKCELAIYAYWYFLIYEGRYGRTLHKYIDEFNDFCGVYNYPTDIKIFTEWHNKEYLRVCMANLYEKYKFGIGKSKITDKEWERLILGYKDITGEDYEI